MLIIDCMIFSLAILLSSNNCKLLVIDIKMSSNREWMYTMRADKNGIFNPEFQQHVKYFLDFAYTNANNIRSKNVEGETVLQIRCPCSECKNRCYKEREMVAYDIYYHGFMGNYSIWYAHGESFPTHEVGECSNPIPSQHVGQRIDHEMAQDIDGEMDQDIDCGMDQDTDSEMDQDPNQTAEAFYALLRQSDVLLWDGFEKASKLSTTARLLNWKSDCNVSDSAYDKLLPIFKDSMPDGAKLPTNFYETKKILKPLELPSEQIHVCLNHCMLFYGRDSDLDHCRICNESRYDERGKAPNLVMTYMPIGPRLQRLFYSKMTAQHLTWHADHRRHPEKMIHPSEGRAWNHFDSTFPDFAKESRNVRLGLCTDGFNPNSSNGKSYSCWPVFATVYNLPPWLALKERYIQIPIIIPGPKNPGQNLDVFLQPLINELKMLFKDGIETYDAYRRNNFQMKAVLLWTISDFPAYAMLSGWSTHGRLACPYCSVEAGAFQLDSGRKPCLCNGCFLLLLEDLFQKMYLRL